MKYTAVKGLKRISYMKKIYVLVLICLCLLLCSCSSNRNPATNQGTSESFTIRNGITFGMTIDQVTKIEGSGYQLQDASLIYEGIEIAGQPDTTIYYIFDNSKKLVEVQYSFNKAYVNSSFYEEIEDFLVGKYGSYIHSNLTGTVCPYTTTKAMKSIYNTQQFYRIHDYRQWVILNSLDGVLIDWVYIGGNVDHPSLRHYYLSYRRITPQEIDDYRQEINDTYNKRNSDL